MKLIIRICKDSAKARSVNNTLVIYNDSKLHHAGSFQSYFDGRCILREAFKVTLVGRCALREAFKVTLTGRCILREAFKVTLISRCTLLETFKVTLIKFYSKRIDCAVIY
jgi:hypothetical protein